MLSYRYICTLNDKEEFVLNLKLEIGIDTLRIIRDDPADKIWEVKDMHKIYRDAVIAIAID
jgi:hypothetical protein